MASRSAGTPATTALAAANVEFRVHEYSVDVAPGRGGDTTYGEAVAVALGVEAGRVFKTLVASCDNELVVAVVPVDSSLDLKALAAATGHKKAELAPADVAERTTGYVLGGISPFGQRRALRTVVDETAELSDTVFVSAGKRGLQVELRPGDLIEVTTALVSPIARR